ncbi:MAG: hypothetical protein LBJ95_01780 [Oscillospiraceae bacterium]|jgi:hypothetical protein|nr:hypothetical protein [Oscillospiraceae bacterium]
MKKFLSLLTAATLIASVVPVIVTANDEAIVVKIQVPNVICRCLWLNVHSNCKYLETILLESGDEKTAYVMANCRVNKAPDISGRGGSWCWSYTLTYSEIYALGGTLTFVIPPGGAQGATGLNYTWVAEYEDGRRERVEVTFG